ncbi:hypothetical protein EJ06DRAFT_535753 [Trichodelitschia bisporula]|uniref:Nudix hydrolase domain-containing protein n=1 Tax=Trichodelitschia bisporula TaxID=703511 RepID=A0A6G1I903_9PEZI|nr:hypothetical protein EJ06DRAFT_535753 [Trichodelitschia bisporula]
MSHQCSVLVVSPTNQVLLLHRVKTSTAFPSAHVFPGGNVSAYHDGVVPPPEHPGRHVDGPAYRLAAIRETFEESGILLARDISGRLLELSDAERESGRKDIHQSKISFPQWLSQRRGTPDTAASLIPYTRWVTPTNVPKRFTTQMYIYFLPVAGSSQQQNVGPLPSSSEAVIPTPTSDGGIEHTAARFLPPSTWLELARSGEVIMFPPQFFLLHFMAQFLNLTAPSKSSSGHLEEQRQKLRDFVKQQEFGDACISPVAIGGLYGNGRSVLRLDSPGPELKGRDRKGVKDWVVGVEFRKEGPRKLEIQLTKDFQSINIALEQSNERGELVDLYVPRKCSATNRIIKAKDHASVQISVGKVDENGRYTGENQTYALCGFVRAMGESDDALNRLVQKDGFLKNVWSASR